MLFQFIQALQLDPLLHARPMLQYWTLSNYTWLIDCSESEAHMKLICCNATLERYIIYSLLHIRAATFTALLHLRAGPLSRALVRLATR